MTDTYKTMTRPNNKENNDNSSELLRRTSTTPMWTETTVRLEGNNQIMKENTNQS